MARKGLNGEKINNCAECNYWNKCGGLFDGSFWTECLLPDWTDPEPDLRSEFRESLDAIIKAGNYATRSVPCPSCGKLMGWDDTEPKPGDVCNVCRETDPKPTSERCIFCADYTTHKVKGDACCEPCEKKAREFVEKNQEPGADDYVKVKREEWSSMRDEARRWRHAFEANRDEISDQIEKCDSCFDKNRKELGSIRAENAQLKHSLEVEASKPKKFTLVCPECGVYTNILSNPGDGGGCVCASCLGDKMRKASGEAEKLKAEAERLKRAEEAFHTTLQIEAEQDEELEKLRTENDELKIKLITEERDRLRAEDEVERLKEQKRCAEHLRAKAEKAANIARSEKYCAEDMAGFATQDLARLRNLSNAARTAMETMVGAKDDFINARGKWDALREAAEKFINVSRYESRVPSAVIRLAWGELGIALAELGKGGVR